MADALATLSLCSGGGGLELGLSLVVRTRVAAFVERDPFAAAVLLARMEDESLEPAPVWCGDLAVMDTAPFRGVDLVTAGFPCPPFSAAGRRQGTDDARWIWPAIARVVRDVGPRFVFLENVPGLLVPAAGQLAGLGHVLRDLAGLGFDAEWGCLRASDVGAPHQRNRVFILAYRHGSQLLGEWLHPGQGGCCDVADPDGDALRLIAERGQLVPSVGGYALAGRTGPHVADAEDAERWSRGAGGAGERRGGFGGDGAVLVHANGLRRQGDGAEPAGTQDPDPCRAVGDVGFWPPGPDDHDGWRRAIAAGCPQPAVRRSAPGLASRLERLRGLGNGCVPQAVAGAFCVLARRAGLL